MRMRLSLRINERKQEIRSSLEGKSEDNIGKKANKDKFRPWYRKQELILRAFFNLVTIS